MSELVPQRSVRSRVESGGQKLAITALPFTVSLAPLLYIWSVSGAPVRIEEVLPLAGLLVVTSVAALMALAAATRNVVRSAVTVAILWIPLLTFGYQRDATGGQPQWWHEPLLLSINAIGVAILLVATWRRDVRRPAAFGALATVVFIASTLPGIASALARPAPAVLRVPIGSGSGPDVYFLVLDAYGRADVLKEVYGHDNSVFLNALRDRGFYIASASYSNYAMTSQSLAATMTMTYLPKAASRDLWHAGNLFRLAPTISIFRQHGYRYVHFESEAWVTADAPLADIVYPLQGLGSEFQRAFLATSLPGQLWLTPARHDVVLNTLRDLREVPAIDGPTFTVAHIISPHPPFMFNEAGVIPGYEDAVTGAYDRDAYAAQVAYLNTEVTRLIDDLIELSDEAPIIILQGDHGPALTIGMDVDDQTIVWERMGILNAMLVPESLRRTLYPSMSPVNTFRILLHGLFGEDLMPIRDRAFYSWYDEGSPAATDGDPARMYEVTTVLLSHGSSDGRQSGG